MGNPTNYNGVGLTWQGKQLKSHTTTNGYMTTVLQFSYDENGLRTEKGFLTDKTYYYYNGSVLIGMQKGNVTQRFSYDASGKVVSVNYNGTDYYYLRNAQGDIVKLIDNNKNTVVEYTYDSWGKILSVTGSLANTVGTNQPFRYRGYVYDNETGWYYLQSRYYDPTTNRFISSDVYLSTGQGVLGHNSYAYCLNNPLAFCDSEGTSAIPWDLLPYWAFAHIAVQLHIIYIAAQSGKLYTMENPVTMLGGINGRIDIYDPLEGYMWEVKPVGSELIGAEQLAWYSSGSVKGGLQPNKIGGPIPSGHIAMGMVDIDYWYAGSGVITYSIKRNKSFDPATAPVPVVKPKRWEELFKKKANSWSLSPSGALAGAGAIAGAGLAIGVYLRGGRFTAFFGFYDYRAI